MPSKTKLRLAAALNLGAAALAIQAQARPLGGVVPTTTIRPSPTVLPAPVASIGASLQAKLTTLTNLTDSAGTVIITFNTSGGLAGVSGLEELLTANLVTVGHRFETLGMISAVLTKAQVLTLATLPAVRSLGANDRLYYSMHQARVLCGVDKLRADNAMTAANGGRVVDGTPATGQIAVAVIDSGIDTTNLDLPFDVATSLLNVVPTTGKVIQNAQVVGNSGVATLTVLENQVNTDTVAHGTHCAGIVGGTGAVSRTTTATPSTGVGYTPGAGATEDFSGVAGRFTGTSTADIANMATASGVKIVGLGSGAALFVLDALGGFDYAIANQVKYNIRLTSNSYGSVGAYDPNDALNVAIKSAYNHNMTTVFAAGNSGPGVDTISSNSKSPYVITVAAGTKEGGLASFSSRGLPASQRTPTGDVVGSNQYNLPAITAPGTGREFLFDGPYDPADAVGTYVAGVSAANPNPAGKKFYSDMISTLAKTGTAARGTNDQEFPTPYQLNYTMISGTSMACPFVAGTVALLLSVNPTLTPDGVKTILQSTATHMPGYEDHEVGAGYVNVYAAVDKTLNPAKPYQPFTFSDSDFNVAIARTLLDPPARPPGFPPAGVESGSSAATGEKFTLPYNPNATPVAATTYAEAVTKAQRPADANGRPSSNAMAFTVGPDLNGRVPTILDVRMKFGQDVNSIAGTLGGNSLGLLLWAPDGTSYSSGIALPVLDDPSRQVVVKNPIQGLWVVELRGLRGLAAVPITPPTGVGLPENTVGQIFRTNLAIQDPGDIAETPQRDAIRFALANRYLDAFLDPNNAGQTLFSPTAKVTRQDFVTALALNTPLRQSLASASPRFTDVTPTISRFAEAASQNGSTLRDFDFAPGPTLPVSASPRLSPATVLTRGQAAIALVRALGLDGEARNLQNVATVTGTYVDPQGNAQALPVSDIFPYDPAEPSANSQNGYLQLAINRGLLPVTAIVRPGQPVMLMANPTRPLIRADLAILANNFRRIFSLGNSLAPSELP